MVSKKGGATEQQQTSHSKPPSALRGWRISQKGSEALTLLLPRTALNLQPSSAAACSTVPEPAEWPKSPTWSKSIRL